MRLLCSLGLIVALTSFSEHGSASPHAARVAPLRRGRSATRSVPSYENPLLASRQVKADALRFPRTKAKRACPSFLPNGNCACPSGTTYCAAEGDCVNVLGNDPANCGACGTTCGSGEACTAGSCTCDTANGYTFQCPDYCLTTDDVFFDSSNCGGCSISCPAGTTCDGGQCVCPGDIPGYEYCPAEGSCVLTHSDPSNCLGCGIVCPSGMSCTPAGCCPSCGTGEVCQSETCVCDAYHGYDSCNGECINTSDYADDPTNCGFCGNNCPANAVCSSGACTCEPCSVGEVCAAGFGYTCICDAANGYVPCDGGCLLATNDVNNCGSCQNKCGSSFICSGGACICPSGTVNCDGSCVDLSTSSDNCSACGTQCGANKVCQGGSCICAPDTVTCNGVPCIDLQDDPNNCGACGAACSNTAICQDGTCVQCPTAPFTGPCELPVCPTDLVYIQCDNVCTPLNDIKNCGGCGIVCYVDPENLENCEWAEHYPGETFGFYCF